MRDPGESKAMMARSLKQEPTEVTMSSKNAIPSQGTSKLQAKRRQRFSISFRSQRNVQRYSLYSGGRKGYCLIIQVKETKGARYQSINQSID